MGLPIHHLTESPYKSCKFWTTRFDLRFVQTTKPKKLPSHPLSLDSLMLPPLSSARARFTSSPPPPSLIDWPEGISGSNEALRPSSSLFIKPVAASCPRTIVFPIFGGSPPSDPPQPVASSKHTFCFAPQPTGPPLASDPTASAARAAAD